MTTMQDSPASGEPITSPPEIHPRFQFGLSTLFWITTGTAILCALVFPMPTVVAIPVMVFISVAVLPAVWTTFIVFGRGSQRAFGIGAMFPAVPLVFYGLTTIGEFGVFSGRVTQWTPVDDEFYILRYVLLLCWASDLVVGFVCMGVRSLLERRRRSSRP